MASMINGRKVDVHILFRSKFNDRKVWTKEECSIEGTEATLKHPRGDVYVMEVSQRDAPSKIVLEIDFRKVKTYTMRARCWHEVKYEGRLIALHFKEDETFDDFYTSLERVLRMYKKYTKPKNGESFLREVEMFQMTQLKPVEGGRRGRAVSLGTTEEESPSSSGTVHGRKTPVTNHSRSLDNFERERRPRLPDLVENVKPAKKTPPSTLQKAKNKPSEAAGTGAIFHRPLPKAPFNSKPQRTPPTPPPRISAGFQQSVEPDYQFVRPETLARTSDEESNGDRPNYHAFARNSSSEDDDDEAFAELPLPPPPPIEMRCSSTDSSASESTAEPSRAYNNRQKKPKPSNNNDEVSGGRSPPRVSQHEPSNFCEHHRPTTSNALPANRDKRPLTNQLAKIKKIIQIPKTRDNDPQRDQVCPHHGPRLSHPSPHPSPPTSPPVQPSQTTNSSIYGMAMHWNCVKCTLQNDFRKLTCKACKWTRTDAWGCSECAIVYSNDLVSCFTCDVWRCRRCTTINKGKHNETTRCPVCGDYTD